jgi:hypothetical protein
VCQQEWSGRCREQGSGRCWTWVWPGTGDGQVKALGISPGKHRIRVRRTGAENGDRQYMIRDGEEWCGESERGWSSESCHSVAARGAAWLRGLCSVNGGVDFAVSRAVEAGCTSARGLALTTTPAENLSSRIL